MDLEQRVAALERTVEQLTELAGLQAAEIARLKLDLELGVQASDILGVEQRVREARELALAAIGLTAA